MNNIITATFGSLRKTRTRPAWIADHGMILRFAGIELPAAYEVHFSNSRSTPAKVSIGDESGVEIPDEYFHNADQIFAWLYLHTGEDDGYTVYEAEIPLIKRSEVTDEQPTPQQESAIEQAIIALNIAVEQCETNVSHYPMIVNDYWVVWDAQIGQFVNTGVQAKGKNGRNGADGRDGRDGTNGAPGEDGEDGFSPTVTVEEIPGGHRVTITDAEGDHVFDVMDGQGGQGSDDVFIAAYGTTTNAEIETALTAGQIVFCKLTNSGVDYYLPLIRRYGSTNHRFGGSNVGNDGIRTVGASCADNEWIMWSRLMMISPSGSTNGDVLAYDGSAWSGKALTASDVGALPDSTTIPEAATATPSDLGTAAVGTSSKYAKEDHVHNKPTYTKSDVGLGNVDNVQQYSANNPPPYPVTSVNNQTGAVSLSIPSTAADVGAVAVAQGISHAGEFCVVGSDGNITTVTMTAWAGGSY